MAKPVFKKACVNVVCRMYFVSCRLRQIKVFQLQNIVMEDVARVNGKFWIRMAVCCH